MSTFQRYSQDDGASYAAAFTYYLFFSIFPLLIFATAALGYLTFGDVQLQKKIFDQGVDAVPMLRDVLSPGGFAAIERRRRELALTGVVLALYTGSGAVVALQHGLNKVWRVPQEPNLLTRRARSLIWLAALGVAALVSVAASAAARFAGEIFESFAPVGDIVPAILLRAVGTAVGVGVFAAAYKFLPSADLSWRDVLPGAVVGAVAIELLKVLGESYLEARTNTRNATFGVFATAAGLLVSSYLIAQITLLSAEVNAVLAERRRTRQSSLADQQGGSRGA